MECEVMSKTYEQMLVVPAGARVIGEVEIFEQTHGFYISAFTTAMLALNESATLITQAEIVKVTKAAGQAWDVGEWIYWDEASSNFTSIPASDRFCVGKAQKAALIGDISGFVMFQDNYHPIQLGTTALPITLEAGQKVVDIHTSSAIVENVEAFRMEMILSGVGATGGRALFQLSTEVQLGGWANALKAIIDFGDTGHVLGLASAFCGELVLPETPPIAGMGNYVCLEAEIVAPAGCGPGSGVSFISCGLAGLGSAAVDDNGFLIDINVGATDNAHIFSEDAGDTATGALRIRVNGVSQWIMLSNVAPGA